MQEIISTHFQSELKGKLDFREINLNSRRISFQGAENAEGAHLNFASGYYSRSIQLLLS
jgi:hypothetical protein